MFKPYESKPVTRMAFQIADTSFIEKEEGMEASYVYHPTGEPSFMSFSFKAYEEPKVNDWIVKLTDKDTYHCTDAVFRERNIVPE